MLVVFFVQYENSQDYFECITIPNADYCEVKFDPNSSTEKNYDYIKFFRDETHEDSTKWGETYSGSGANKNFPGFEGRPALLIPANTFHMQFHSDCKSHFF